MGGSGRLVKRDGEDGAPERPSAWGVAVKQLAMRALTTEELRRRLRRSGYTEDEIQPVLARLIASRYIDDAEYARAWAHARAHRHSVGPARVAQELRAKGIAEAEIAPAIRDAFGEGGDQGIAEAAASRKVAALRGVAPDAARRRLGAYLSRKGFAAEIVLALCRKYFPHGQDPIDS